MGLIASL
jgi:hypothetical protein